jgi:cobalt-zinc-cadmium efflux system membrane fusion protein
VSAVPEHEPSRFRAFLRRHREHMPRRLPRLVVVLLILLVPVVVLVRRLTRTASETGHSKSADTGAVVLGEAARKNAGVAVETVKRMTRSDRLEAPGVLAIDEARTARIGSLVEGVVTSVMAEVGDRVAAGQRLADLHSHVVHDAWADYRKAVADRRRRETELQYATLSAERAGRLFEAKALSFQERQRAETDRVAAAEELDRARTEVRRSEEALEHLGITSGEDPSGEKGEEIPVKAPFSGVVLDKKVTTGTAVTPGAPLFVVSDLSNLWAIAEVDETKLPLVRAGETAEVRVSAWPGEVFRGRVAFVGDAVNPKTRRVTVRCQVPNPAGRLKPEMYASISIGEGAPRPILAVPSRAVQEMDGRTVVFVAGAAGRFARREVTVGADAEGWVEVVSGLREGEAVASDGSFLLKSELMKGSEPEGG